MMNEASETVKLFKFPLNIAVVDNDIDYLSLIHQHLKHTTFSSFSSPITALNKINPIEIDIKTFIKEKHSGMQELNYNSIKNFIQEAQDTQGVLIVDYDMPEMNGIELISNYSNKYNLIKVLLTNVYGIDGIVNALNKRDITYYLPKDKVTDLLAVINAQENKLFDNTSKQIENFLDTNRLKFLSCSSYASIFNSIAKQYKIRTYYVLNNYGHYYLQNSSHKFIFSIYHLNDLVEIAKKVSEQNKNDVEQGNLVPLFLTDSDNEYKLVKAIKVGDYTYCVEQIS